MWYQSESARPMPPASVVSVGIAQAAKTAAQQIATSGSPKPVCSGAGGGFSSAAPVSRERPDAANGLRTAIAITAIR